MQTISKELLTTCFHHLRHAGFAQQLGIGELLAAVPVVAEGEESRWAEKLKLLWCKSLKDRIRFDQVWQEIRVFSGSDSALIEPSPEENSRVTFPTVESKEPTSVPGLTPTAEAEPTKSIPFSPTGQLTPLPVCVPPLQSRTQLKKLDAYWPVSPREMVLAWRYLRRLLPAGNAVVLDLQETLRRTVYQGFYSGPSYRRRLRNQAQLLLLIDQNGSMMPFHPLTREIVKVVQASTIQVKIGYFQNWPGESLYQEAHLLDPLKTSTVWQECSIDTNILIISDAGAARGFRRPERVRETRTWLSELQKYTNHLAWLNPMPKTRWAGTSANWIAQLVPMFEISEMGFRQAITAL